MPKMEMNCTQAFKDSILDHIGQHPERYRGQSHFMQESMLLKIEVDTQRKQGNEKKVDHGVS